MMPVQRNDYHARSEEDMLIDQEIKARRDLAKTFNLKRQDFDDDGGTPSYENYKEKVEDIIEMDPDVRTEKVAAFQKENRHKIELTISRDMNERQAKAGKAAGSSPEIQE